MPLRRIRKQVLVDYSAGFWGVSFLVVSWGGGKNFELNFMELKLWFAMIYCLANDIQKKGN